MIVALLNSIVQVNPLKTKRNLVRMAYKVKFYQMNPEEKDSDV